MSRTRNNKNAAPENNVPFDHSIMFDVLFHTVEEEVRLRRYDEAHLVLKKIISIIVKNAYEGMYLEQEHKQRVSDVIGVLENAFKHDNLKYDCVKLTKAEYFYRTNNIKGAKQLLKAIHQHFYANDEGLVTLASIEKLNPYDWDILLLRAQWMQQVGKVEESRAPLQRLLNFSDASVIATLHPTKEQKTQAQLFLNLVNGPKRQHEALDIGKLAELGIARQKTYLFYQGQKREAASQDNKKQFELKK